MGTGNKKIVFIALYFQWYTGTFGETLSPDKSLFDELPMNGAMGLFPQNSQIGSKRTGLGQSTSIKTSKSVDSTTNDNTGSNLQPSLFDELPNQGAMESSNSALTRNTRDSLFTLTSGGSVEYDIHKSEPSTAFNVEFVENALIPQVVNSIAKNTALPVHNNAQLVAAAVPILAPVQQLSPSYGVPQVPSRNFHHQYFHQKLPLPPLRALPWRQQSLTHPPQIKLKDQLHDKTNKSYHHVTANAAGPTVIVYASPEGSRTFTPVANSNTVTESSPTKGNQYATKNEVHYHYHINDAERNGRHHSHRPRPTQAPSNNNGWRQTPSRRRPRPLAPYFNRFNRPKYGRHHGNNGGNNENHGSGYGNTGGNGENEGDDGEDQTSERPGNHGHGHGHGNHGQGHGHGNHGQGHGHGNHGHGNNNSGTSPVNNSDGDQQVDYHEQGTQTNNQGQGGNGNRGQGGNGHDHGNRGQGHGHGNRGQGHGHGNHGQGHGNGNNNSGTSLVNNSDGDQQVDSEGNEYHGQGSNSHGHGNHGHGHGNHGQGGHGHGNHGHGHGNHGGGSHGTGNQENSGNGDQETDSEPGHNNQGHGGGNQSNQNQGNGWNGSSHGNQGGGNNNSGSHGGGNNNSGHHGGGNNNSGHHGGGHHGSGHHNGGNNNGGDGGNNNSGSGHHGGGHHNGGNGGHGHNHGNGSGDPEDGPDGSNEGPPDGETGEPGETESESNIGPYPPSGQRDFSRRFKNGYKNSKGFRARQLFANHKRQPAADSISLTYERPPPPDAPVPPPSYGAPKPSYGLPPATYGPPPTAGPPAPPADQPVAEDQYHTTITLQTIPITKQVTEFVQVPNIVHQISSSQTSGIVSDEPLQQDDPPHSSYGPPPKRGTKGKRIQAHQKQQASSQGFQAHLSKFLGSTGIPSDNAALLLDPNRNRLTDLELLELLGGSNGRLSQTSILNQLGNTGTPNIFGASRTPLTGLRQFFPSASTSSGVDSNADALREIIREQRYQNILGDLRSRLREESKSADRARSDYRSLFSKGALLLSALTLLPSVVSPFASVAAGTTSSLTNYMMPLLPTAGRRKKRSFYNTQESVADSRFDEFESCLSNSTIPHFTNGSHSEFEWLNCADVLHGMENCFQEESNSHSINESGCSPSEIRSASQSVISQLRLELSKYLKAELLLRNSRCLQNELCYIMKQMGSMEAEVNQPLPEYLKFFGQINNPWVQQVFSAFNKGECGIFACSN